MIGCELGRYCCFLANTAYLLRWVLGLKTQLCLRHRNAISGLDSDGERKSKAAVSRVVGEGEKTCASLGKWQSHVQQQLQIPLINIERRLRTADSCKMQKLQEL
jgi:hypothetical protein